jgi:GNAT superfamily N-acetyltransferase
VPLLDLPPFHILSAADVSSEIRIEAVRPRDVARLLELIRALAEYEKLSHLVVGTEDQLHEELFGPRPVIESVLAWDGGQALGFALFFHNYSTFLTRRGLYLEDLFVVPEARGRGIGKALIRHGAQLAVARGCGRYEWSVLDWNTPAIAFYESLGASMLGDWRICRTEGDALARLAAPATP